MDPVFDQITKAVVSGDLEIVRGQVQAALDDDFDVTAILNDGLLRAMRIIGDRFERNEIYVTELLISARAVQSGIDVIRPHLMKKDIDMMHKGKIIIGTVAGDLHDIGKNLLSLVLEAHGFEVIDLGVDVSPSAFVEAVTRHQPDVVCLSALLTTTARVAGDTIDVLDEMRQSGYRFSVVVGGAAISRELASAIGADGYAPDAISGGKLIEEIVEREREIDSGHVLGRTYGIDELETLQTSFSELTGVDLVVVDEFGSPYVGGEGFCSCSHHCADFAASFGDLQMHEPTPAPIFGADLNAAVAYRCRCGLMELSFPVNGENGSLGTILCGHFLLKGDGAKKENIPDGIRILNEDELSALCRLVGVIGRKIAGLVDNMIARRQMEGQKTIYRDFMKKQRKLEEELKEAELSALQNQVNPHFLFNSLNTIARVAVIEGDPHTEKLVSALARLMRYSLYQVKATVTLEEEVKTVTDYLMIQETRFQGRITHRIDIEPSITMAKMPCMILQPLVENACQHGLEPTKRGGIISIQGWLENGNVFLEVSDNGVGMSEEQQRSIFKLEDIHSTKGGQVSGIGINNVLSRLQFFFGSDCAWDINSTLNKGTTLQISFPLKTN